MKRIWILGALIFMLAGYAAQQTFETIGDACDEPVSGQLWQIAMDLPGEMAIPVMQTENADKLYLGDGFTLSTHIAQAGDLNRTLLEYTGFSGEKLEVISTDCGKWKRYDAAWTSAGEGGAQTGRIAILDDGKSHYVLQAMTPAENAGETAALWQPIFRSFRLESAQMQVNSGS